MYPPTPGAGKARSRLSARVTGTRQDGAAFPACCRVTGPAPWCRIARAVYGGVGEERRDERAVRMVRRGQRCWLGFYSWLELSDVAGLL